MRECACACVCVLIVGPQVTCARKWRARELIRWIACSDIDGQVRWYEELDKGFESASSSRCAVWMIGKMTTIEGIERKASECMHCGHTF